MNTPAPNPKTTSSNVPVASVELVHNFVAVFAVAGKGNHVISVPHTQKPDIDRAAAWKAIRAQFPKAKEGDIRRVGGAIKSAPEGGQQPILLPEGATIRQLFPDGSEHEAARLVGTVTFADNPCELILRFIRASSKVSVSLREIGTNSTLRFSESFAAGRAIEELPKVILSALGSTAKELHLFIKVAKR
jgi:hypothetical protein